MHFFHILLNPVKKYDCLLVYLLSLWRSRTTTDRRILIVSINHNISQVMMVHLPYTNVKSYKLAYHTFEGLFVVVVIVAILL